MLLTKTEVVESAAMVMSWLQWGPAQLAPELLLPDTDDDAYHITWHSGAV